jgi:hypothetical protein
MYEKLVKKSHIGMNFVPNIEGEEIHPETP